ncbi:hypothetical protein GCM10027046_04560 [Uliginosibacterium flavum]|uniref:histidine kinase n=1 Tax=Uliginosibacterium flavum TaxID=1396831 RepID=A0ABV2TJ72_9RHOO
MMDKDEQAEVDAASGSALNTLRLRAERRWTDHAMVFPDSFETHSPEAVQRLLHDLRVHQIELEMQNEELRESQAALDASRARYFDLYDLAPVGYCTVSVQGLILQANLTAASLLGVPRSALVKQPLSRLIVKEDQDIYYLQRKQLLESAEPQSCELRMLKNDGAQFWAKLMISAAHDADGAPELRVVISDVSVRKLAEEALFRAELMQNAIFHSANFSMIATDAQGVIQLFNIGAERMLGYAAADVLNKITPADISDPQELIARAEALSFEFGNPITPGFEALTFKAAHNIVDMYELTYLCQDGSRIPAAVSVTALRDAQEQLIGYLLIGTDNTARKRVEAERTLFDQLLQDKNLALEAARFAAERANRAKSDFLSSMSHELRTPLGAILGFAQLIESGTPLPTPTQKRSVEQILKAGWYLLDLINEILDLALIESGKLSLSVEPVSLGDVMLECESLIESQAQKYRVSVVFPELESPHCVQGDRMRVKQVLVNFLSNAIKYNKVGGAVAVTCSRTAEDLIRISVRDTGAGLSPEQLGQLFQPFNRLGQEANVVEGTGIGLVVSKRLVELMEGRIGAESVVGEGCEFWIELKPMTALQSAANIVESRSEYSPIKSADALRTLLYVEDNPANLMLIEDLIARRPDLELLSAQDGQQGIEMARKVLPDVILMDINLPGVSGIKALKVLGDDPNTAHIPIIALSANAIPRDIENGLKAGFFRYLTKPIKVAEFMDTLDLALKFTEK